MPTKTKQVNGFGLMIVFLLAVSVLGGCLEQGEDNRDGMDSFDSSQSVDHWGGKDRLTVVEVEADVRYEFDILCVFDGGPILNRESDTFVLPGTGHLEFTVRVDTTFTGLQVGYVVEENPGNDEVHQEGITWLPVVRGEERVFRVDVTTESFEEPGEPRLWAFYHRMQPMDDMTDCYTGGGTGKWYVLVEAVRGDFAD